MSEADLIALPPSNGSSSARANARIHTEQGTPAAVRPAKQFHTSAKPRDTEPH
jgi:hypothetical protein